MATFDQFSEELNELGAQQDSAKQALEQFRQEYCQQANEAERLFLEKQALEEKQRNVESSKRIAQ
jgi:hypothetical protein